MLLWSSSDDAEGLLVVIDLLLERAWHPFGHPAAQNVEGIGRRCLVQAASFRTSKLVEKVIIRR